MAKRHDFRPGDWESAAVRLDEIIGAHSGEDPFEEALKLLVAKLADEMSEGAPSAFLAQGRGEDAIREMNRLLGIAVERWSGVLESGATTRLSAVALERCAAVLRSLRLLADDLIGLDSIFEFIVNKAAKGQKGQYFTPRHVVAEVVAMVCPQARDRVADPACGSGGFLRHALHHQPHCSVWGFDQDPRAVRVARVMMAASGQAASCVMRVDSLRRPLAGSPVQTQSAATIEGLMPAQDATFRGFDVLLTNPPFAGDVGPDFGDSYFLARGKRVERDVLFVERCVELLRPGGRLAIVLPHNKVGGARWGYLREWLLQQVQIVAVLGLGRNTFQPHTSQKACVLIGQKRHQPAARIDAHANDEILFFICERDGKDARGRLLYESDGRAVAHDLADAVPRVRERFDLLTRAA